MTPPWPPNRRSSTLTGGPKLPARRRHSPGPPSSGRSPFSTFPLVSSHGPANLKLTFGPFTVVLNAPIGFVQEYSAEYANECTTHDDPDPAHG